MRCWSVIVCLLCAVPILSGCATNKSVARTHAACQECYAKNMESCDCYIRGQNLLVADRSIPVAPRSTEGLRVDAFTPQPGDNILLEQPVTPRPLADPNAAVPSEEQVASPVVPDQSNQLSLAEDCADGNCADENCGTPVVAGRTPLFSGFAAPKLKTSRNLFGWISEKCSSVTLPKPKMWIPRMPTMPTMPTVQQAPLYPQPYPYYTIRGPRDFLAREYKPLGP